MEDYSEQAELNTVTISRANQLLEWKKYDEALEEAMKLLQEDPEYSEGYSLTALIYYHMDEYDKALHWSDEALQRDPENLQAWFVKTIAYYDTASWKKFDVIIHEAIALDPDESAYYYLLANRMQTAGDYKAAREQMLIALKLKPDNGTYLANMSYLEALTGDFAASKALEQAALEQDVESTYVYLHLSWAADRRGDDKNQLLFLENAIQLDPDNEEVRAEYLEGLQKTYLFYRIILLPSKLLKKLKPWQVMLSWVIAWIVFKPLVIVFLVLYVFGYWSSKLLVHVKVYGWRFPRSK